MTAVRRYRPEDRAATAAFFHQAVREGTAGIYSAAQRQNWARSNEPDLNSPDPREDQLAWVSESDGQMTGFMAMTITGYPVMAFVVPAAVGKGHAAALHDACLTHAKAAGLPKLTFHAGLFARRFLEKRGWKVNEGKNFVSASGVHLDRFAMSLAGDSLVP